MKISAGMFWMISKMILFPSAFKPRPLAEKIKLLGVCVRLFFKGLIGYEQKEET